MADGRGISYYIPPEFRRMGKSAMELLSAIDPAQGIMRGMAASGRAFDSDLPADERKAAAIEAGVETLFPVGMIGMGAAAKQPAKAVLMDILTPTGATKDIAEDTLADPSRRKFLQGAAAAVPVAAVAPDVITDVVTKATKAGGRAAINPLDMAVANIKELRRQIDEQFGILDELEGLPVGQANRDAQNAISTAEFEIIDETFDAIIGLKPEEFSEAVANVSDDTLETLIEPQYESIMGNQRLVDDGENSVRLAEEVKRRGMHLAKDKNGIDRFPNARAYVEDFDDPIARDSNIILPKDYVDDSLLDPIGVYRDDGNLNMTRQTPPDIEEDILELKLTELRRQIAQADRVMRVDGKTTKEIDEFKAQKRREMFELQNLPPDMDDFYAAGGEVQRGVGSLNRRARDMFRGPRGIESLSRFANGGEATMTPREASEHMADVEYEQQILSTADDPLVRLGLDPSVARVTTRVDSYSPTMDRLNISAYLGLMSPETQAHEFRHRGLEILLNDYIKLEPFTFRKKYGPDAWKLAQKLWEQSRPGGRPEDVADSVQEQVAELFQKPASVSRTEYYSSDGRVFHSKDTVEEYIRQNPDLEYEANTVTRNLEDTLETPRVLEFRDYMINKNRGESPSRDPYFEGVLGFQEAASDALTGKYFGYANGGAADISEYRKALIASESSGDVGAENPSGAVGLTQAMPDTLEDFKRETGLEFTPEQYANSRELQTQFQDWYEQKTINYIMDQGLDRYIGQTIKGVPITMSSMLGMAHLGGDYGMRKFIETGGRYDPDDGYTKLSDYGRKFANMSIVGQGEVGYNPSPEEILMSMPVEQEAEFTNPRGYSPIPRLRPQYMPTEPMPRPRLRPDEEETAQTTPYMGVIPGRRTNLYEEYGGGITTLANP
jgi:hypothetical protein